MQESFENKLILFELCILEDSLVMIRISGSVSLVGHVSRNEERSIFQLR